MTKNCDGTQKKTTETKKEETNIGDRTEVDEEHLCGGYRNIWRKKSKGRALGISSQYLQGSKMDIYCKRKEEEMDMVASLYNKRRVFAFGENIKTASNGQQGPVAD